MPPEVIADFCRRHRVRRLSLFGSVLRDDFRPESDIDILVEFEPGAGVGYFGLFDMKEAEAAVAKGISDQLGAEVEVSCGERWRVGEVGDTFECEGEGADGPIPPVTITVKDAGGNIGWSME